MALFSLVILVCVTVVFGTHLHSDISTECYTQYPSGIPSLRCLFWFRYYMSFRNTVPIGYLFYLGAICAFGTPLQTVISYYCATIFLILIRHSPCYSYIQWSPVKVLAVIKFKWGIFLFRKLKTYWLKRKGIQVYKNHNLVKLEDLDHFIFLLLTTVFISKMTHDIKIST